MNRIYTNIHLQINLDISRTYAVFCYYLFVVLISSNIKLQLMTERFGEQYKHYNYRNIWSILFSGKLIRLMPHV